MPVGGSITLNGYFRSQAVTGQQRFAREIADRLVAMIPHIRERKPSPAAALRPVVAWAEVQLLPLRDPTACIVSLTSRAPAISRRHIVTVHDLFPLTNPEWYSKSYARVHQLALIAQLKTAAGIIAVSEPVRDHIQSRFRPSVPVVVAPNGVSRQWTTNLAARKRAVASSGPDSRPFLTVGSLDPRKRLDRVIAAHASLPEAIRKEHPLWVVGGSADHFSKVSLPLEQHIRYLGYVSDEQLADLYRRAVAVISFSEAEGFGLPLIEADAAGCPVICSDIEAYRWVTSDGATLVNPRRKEEAKSALLSAAHAYGSAPRVSRFAHRFSWDDSAKVICDLIGVVCDQ